MTLPVGLGIADVKQGVALILHTVELLAKSGFADYAQLGVLVRLATSSTAGN